jgi:hypothetical protein
MARKFRRAAAAHATGRAAARSNGRSAVSSTGRFRAPWESAYSEYRCETFASHVACNYEAAQHADCGPIALWPDVAHGEATWEDGRVGRAGEGQ